MTSVAERLHRPMLLLLRLFVVFASFGAALALPKELGGRDGPEPVRYGDWEKKGIAVDF